MIWSVSTLLRRSGTPVPVWLMNLSMGTPVRLVWTSVGVDEIALQVGRRAERSGDRCGRGDRGRDQVGATTLALSTLEVAVGRRSCPLPRRQLVRVHPETHRA